MFLSKYLYEIPEFLTSQFFLNTTNSTIMKKVILGAFMLLAVAGTTMAQSAKQDSSTAKHSGKMHHGKKHHHKMAAKTSASGTAKGTSSSTQK